MDIEITFINQSNDTNNSNVVIFSKNVAANFEEIAVAWRVIENCGRNWRHKFIYPMDFYVGAQDSWGNVSDLQLAENGQVWEVIRSSSGDILNLSPEYAPDFNEVVVKNALSVGSVNAQIYRDGHLFAMKSGVSPQQKAVFSFKPTLWIGVVSEVEEGDVMNSAILSGINTEISMLGITRANLIMTGGGEGSMARSFVFTLVPTA